LSHEFRKQIQKIQTLVSSTEELKSGYRRKNKRKAAPASWLRMQVSGG
jgi:hypothetical protein